MSIRKYEVEAEFMAGLPKDSTETLAPSAHSAGGRSWGAGDLSQINAVRLNGVRVLIADDSIDNQRLFQRILKSAGALVEVAGNGELAVSLQAICEFDVVILDICMPVMDGYEAAKTMRRRGFPGPIIALTAHDTPGEEKRCLMSGCSAFYLKPIDRLGLLRAVERAVGVRIG